MELIIFFPGVIEIDQLCHCVGLVRVFWEQMRLVKRLLGTGQLGHSVGYLLEHSPCNRKVVSSTLKTGEAAIEVLVSNVLSPSTAPHRAVTDGRPLFIMAHCVLCSQ